MPKSTKPRNLKKPGPQPIKNHKITAKITPCLKQAKTPPDTKKHPSISPYRKQVAKPIVISQPILSTEKDDIK